MCKKIIRVNGVYFGIGIPSPFYQEPKIFNREKFYFFFHFFPKSPKKYFSDGSFPYTYHDYVVENGVLIRHFSSKEYVNIFEEIDLMKPFGRPTGNYVDVRTELSRCNDESEAGHPLILHKREMVDDEMIGTEIIQFEWEGFYFSGIISSNGEMNLRLKPLKYDKSIYTNPTNFKFRFVPFLGHYD